MSAFGSGKSYSLFVEFGESTLKVLAESGGFEVPIDRLENGCLSESGKARITAAIRGFLDKQNLGKRVRAICAIGARGVSLRRLTLPPAAKEEVARLIHLQIENEFPLPPEELAWGYQFLGTNERNGDGARGSRELLVAALKKEVIEEYSEILSGSGVKAVFTVAALARDRVFSNRPISYSVLDIGSDQSELVLFENGVAVSLHVLPWGTGNIGRALEGAAAQDEGASGRSGAEYEAGTDASREELSARSVRDEAKRLSSLIGASPAGRKVFVAGENLKLAAVTRELRSAMDGAAELEQTEFSAETGRSAATVGLMTASAKGAAGSLLALEVRETADGESIVRQKGWRWAALAAALAICSISFRYIEAYVKKPELAQRLSEIRAEKNKLPEIDREVAFMQFLNTNRAPYLEAISVLADAAAGGARFETLSLNRRGELSLRGTMGNSQQATDFRKKLIESGLFSSVSVEEQNPDRNRQKIGVRITARWNVAQRRGAESAVNQSEKKPPDRKGLEK